MTLHTASAQERRPATVRDVAELAQVSTATVSRVLNDSDAVAEATRRRVTDAMRRLDFIANHSARTMQPGARSLSWGLLIDHVDTFYFGRLVAELDRAAQEAGSTLFTTSTQRQRRREVHLVREMRGRRIDGLLVVPTGDDGRSGHSHPGSMPIVYVDRIPRGTVDVDVVTFDYYSPIAAEMERLWSRGHRRFAFIGGNVAADPGTRRMAAWSDFMHEHGLAIDRSLVSTNNDSEEEAARAALAMLEGPNPPTAITTTHAALLLGTLEVVVARGDAVEILASEDISGAFLSPVPLHLIISDPVLIARTAAQRLQQRIDGADVAPEVTFLETQTMHLGPRNSSHHD